VLFLLFGSSASGKTFVLNELRGRVPDLAIHDFDEIGVPPRADTPWRHRANEQWVRRALEYEAEGIDLLLAGQTPFGELLAAPSATRLEAISACLLDCADDTGSSAFGLAGPNGSHALRVSFRTTSTGRHGCGGMPPTRPGRQRSSGTRQPKMRCAGRLELVDGR
jgi:hypothetical protein